MEFAIQRAKRHGDRETVQQLNLQRRTLPSQDPNDPDYRRLHYVRYADDWLLGFAGPKHEAEEIKSKIRLFLREKLMLELSESKTLITHAARRHTSSGTRSEPSSPMTRSPRTAGRSTAELACSCLGR